MRKCEKKEGVNKQWITKTTTEKEGKNEKTRMLRTEREGKKNE